MSKLSPRDQKGYDWEVEIQDLLSSLKIEFLGNPRDPSSWSKCRIRIDKASGRQLGNNVDIIIPQLNIEVECKSVSVDVWASGLLHNYIARFSDSKVKIIVTNDLTKFNSKCREILREAGIKLLNKEYFTQFINGLLNQHKGSNRITYYPIVLEDLFRLRESRGQSVEELGSFLDIYFDQEYQALCLSFQNKVIFMGLPQDMEFYPGLAEGLD